MKRHHVKANETLWEIAKTVGAASEKDDIREIVEDIRDANEIGPRDYLQEGSIIMVPIYKKK